MHWKKGLIYTLEALSNLKEKYAFQYEIIGDGDELERLKFAVYQLGLEDNVIFAGICDKNEIKMKLQNSSIYLQYSVQEGFCNAVLEAQSMGLLCVVSNAEGLSENVIHNKTGWIVPSRQSKKLAQTLNDILNLPNEELIKFKTAAINRVREEFSLTAQNVKFQKFYE